MVVQSTLGSSSLDLTLNFRSLVAFQGFKIELLRFLKSRLPHLQSNPWQYSSR